MAQSHKYYWKRVRDVAPCVQCGAGHQTRFHGKDEKEVAFELRSRHRNPQDPQFTDRKAYV